MVGHEIPLGETDAYAPLPVNGPLLEIPTLVSMIEWKLSPDEQKTPALS